jgi:hypothetical protein
MDYRRWVVGDECDGGIWDFGETDGRLKIIRWLQ